MIYAASVLYWSWDCAMWTWSDAAWTWADIAANAAPPTITIGNAEAAMRRAIPAAADATCSVLTDIAARVLWGGSAEASVAIDAPAVARFLAASAASLQMAVDAAIGFPLARLIASAFATLAAGVEGAKATANLTGAAQAYLAVDSTALAGATHPVLLPPTRATLTRSHL